MLKHTPLHSMHERLGARMVDFAGWHMPLHYGSQVEEHHQVRRDAAMFDVSHMLAIDVEGNEAKPFLLHLISNNIDKLRELGRALYSCMLNTNGGVIDDLIVYFLAPNTYRVVVNAGTAEKDLAWIGVQAKGRAVTLTPRADLALIAVQGPNAREKVWRAIPDSETATAQLKPFYATPFKDLFIARTGYTGEDGFEMFLPAVQAENIWNQLLAVGVKPAGLGARDTLRLEAGMNLYGQDMDEQTSPLDAGLTWTIDLSSERDFVGKSTLVNKSASVGFYGLVLKERGVLRAHQKVFSAHGEGEITSGSFSPTLNQSIALARLPLGLVPGDWVEVEIRDKRLKAQVVKPPFVRQGKVLV